MESRRKSRASFALVVCMTATAATGCATKPLFSPRTAELDDTAIETQAVDADRSPIQLVNFPKIEMLPLWPDQDEVSEASTSVATPLAAGTEAVKRGAGQIRQGFVNFGHGARRAFDSTTTWLSRPLVAVRATPGEPSLLQKMFSPEPTYDPPRTTREFLAQERVQ